MKLSRRRLIGSSAALAALGGIRNVQGTNAQTPTASRAAPNAALRDLATFIPLSVASDNFESGAELLTFGDFALRLNQVGIDLDAIPDPGERLRTFAGATMPVPISQLVMASFQATDPIALLGWTADEIDQNADLMSNASTLTVLRGRWDAAKVQQAWETNGYAPLDIDGAIAATIAPDPSVDISTELGRVALSKANNVAIVDDTTLIYSSTLSHLEEMLLAHRGERDSLGAMTVFESLTGVATAELSGAIVLPPGAFIASPAIVSGDDGIEFATTWEPGPVPLLGLIGFASGPAVPDSDISEDATHPGPSGSRQIAIRHFLTEEEMVLAAKRSLIVLESQGSLQTGQPWTEIFAGWQVSTDPASTAVITDIGLFDNEAVWSSVFFRRDASYLYG